MSDQQRELQDDTGPADAGRSAAVSAHDQTVEPSRAFEELSKLVLGKESLTAVLQRVAELAKSVIPDTHEVSVTLLKDDKEPETVVFTGSLAYSLDERQYEAGFGPCMDAAVAGTTIRVANADPDTPYPEFSRVSLRAGVTHSLSVGLPVQQRIVGGLNMYAVSDRPFDDDAVELAESFAQYAGVAIANAALYSSTADLANHMQAAMQSRAVIEQAKGIIMGRNRCSADKAFTILVTMSQRHNQKLRTLAQELVDRTKR
jgi:GAF domain-containing protein